MKRCLVIIFSLLLFQTLSAQITFHFVPEVNAKNIDGLGNFKAQNLTAGRIYGNVFIIVKHVRTNQRVVQIETNPVAFSPGINSLPPGLFTSSRFQFSSTNIASIVNQTRSFPPGDYEICYRFVAQDKSFESESCFDANVLPLVPIELIQPYNLDTICNQRPVLSWQPPLPYYSSMRFRLVLSEKKTTDKAAVEGITLNAPLLLLDNIQGTTVNYPANYPELKEGRTYYWQVAAYQQGIIISVSEIWEFTVSCKEPLIEVPKDSYRELKLLLNGNYYIANRFLRFSFNNQYKQNALKYEIYDLTKERKPIKYLPSVKLVDGLNKIDIDLIDSELTPGTSYLLKVYPFNEPPVEIRFIYEEKASNE